MRCPWMRSAGLILLVGCAVAPALALGPVDGEVGAVYWHNDVDAASGPARASTDASAPGYRAEVWFLQRYGVRAGAYSSDVDETGDSADYTSVDVLWRPFSPSENNFVAVGLGWQQMDLGLIGLDGDTSGVRISAEGRVALGGLFYGYVQGAYFPSLDDAPGRTPTDGRFEELSGHEYEVGVSWKTAPFLALRAGYRTQSVDFTQTDFLLGAADASGQVESSGFLLGLSVRF